MVLSRCNRNIAGDQLFKEKRPSSRETLPKSRGHGKDDFLEIARAEASRLTLKASGHLASQDEPGW
jgi:hypothetical protein